MTNQVQDIGQALCQLDDDYIHNKITEEYYVKARDSIMTNYYGFTIMTIPPVFKNTVNDNIMSNDKGGL